MVCTNVGFKVGNFVGDFDDGLEVGLPVGSFDGDFEVGKNVDLLVGSFDGFKEGSFDGCGSVGTVVGFKLGSLDGDFVVGQKVVFVVGYLDGKIVGSNASANMQTMPIKAANDNSCTKLLQFIMFNGVYIAKFKPSSFNFYVVTLSSLDP